MEPKLVKIKPKPPVPLPVKREPKQRLRPAPSMLKELFIKWKSKTILRSRGISTFVVTIVGFILIKILGLDVDLGTYIQTADGIQLGEAVLATGLTLAAAFRKYIKADLSKPSTG